MFFDPYWILISIPGLLLGLYAQFKLSSTYRKYMRVGVSSGLTGAQAARRVLDQNGLSDVPIQEIPGQLNDHYDPQKRALFLSTANFNERSVSAVGVAAHEAGHALQQHVGYAPLNFRMGILPVTQFASHAWSLIFLASMFLYGSKIITPVLFSHLIWVAVGLFAFTALFQLITLPVEYDASRRAKEQLFRLGIVQGEENGAVKAVLSAAALTYVAGMVTAILQLIYLLSYARNRNQ